MCDQRGRSHSEFVVQQGCIERERVWLVPVLSPLVRVPLLKVTIADDYSDPFDAQNDLKSKAGKGESAGYMEPYEAQRIMTVSPGKAAKLRKAGLLVESSPQACRDTHSRHHAPSPPPTCQHPHQAQRSSPEPSSALRTSGGSHGLAPPCSFH
ncbi:hypothetical protein J1605_018949 [Eschrichtius robustus]|uniref:Uncharacterized protein n=1 Tax=Eschrichtius robustus TaxID=9764 RepID=A0AB34HTY2_ESCRO|nr:hypothetical protein J1605_018949 [Eschrichtius robustus]